MYRSYARGDSAWFEGVRSAARFIAGPLHHHVTTWSRHGRLGVPDGLNCMLLCELLPRVVQDHGEFGLLIADTGPRLLVLPLRSRAEPAALCYGPWPGIEIWDDEVEPHLPSGVTLLHTHWNEVPDLRNGVSVPSMVRRDGPHDGWRWVRLGTAVSSLFG